MLRKLKKWLRRLTHPPAEKGLAGEEALAEALTGLRFWRDRPLLLRNVYLPRPGGGTTEIDLLLLTRKGLFVIESKNYAGYVFADPDAREWTQSLHAGRGLFGRQKYERHAFYNPIWQNRGHLRALRAYLGEGIPLYSFVVFADDCTVEGVRPSTRGEAVVCNACELRRFLRKKRRWRRRCLRKREVQALYDALEPLTEVSRRVRRQHIREVREWQ